MGIYSYLSILGFNSPVVIDFDYAEIFFLLSAYPRHPWFRIKIFVFFLLRSDLFYGDWELVFLLCDFQLPFQGWCFLFKTSLLIVLKIFHYQITPWDLSSGVHIKYKVRMCHQNLCLLKQSRCILSVYLVYLSLYVYQLLVSLLISIAIHFVGPLIFVGCIINWHLSIPRFILV